MLHYSVGFLFSLLFLLSSFFSLYLTTMKLSSSKWILSCIFISLILVNAQPTSNVRKRQDASAQESDIAQYHHQPTTITRTSTSTAKSTSTPTSGGSGTSSGQNNGSGGNSSEPYIIPAYTSPWFGKKNCLDFAYASYY